MPLTTSLVRIYENVITIGEKDVRIVYVAELNRIDEERKRILENYNNRWTQYGETWLEKFLDFHRAVYRRAGFETKEDCIAWLKKYGSGAC